MKMTIILCLALLAAPIAAEARDVPPPQVNCGRGDAYCLRPMPIVEYRPVDEPGSLALLGVAAVVGYAIRRRRK